MCGFYFPNMIEKWKDYDFFDKNNSNSRNDYFESSFIASKKNNPLVDKWHYVLKTFWNNRK